MKDTRRFLSAIRFRNLLAFSVLGCLFLASAAYAADPRWEEPWGKQSSPESSSPGAPQLSPGQKIAQGAIRVFQKYISPVDGDRCPSYPTCSQYGVLAVRKHGLMMGFVMTFDRLIHESDEVRRAPLIKVYDSHRYYDPVENNDFWWDKK